MPVLDAPALFDDRLAAIRAAHQRTGIERAELDLSGGIDSAAMACLLVTALGPENVTLVHSKFSTNHEQTERAEALAAGLGCRLIVGGFGGSYAVLMGEFKRSLKAAGYSLDEIESRMAADPTIEGSIRSTLRAPIGRAYNRMTGGGIRHGTGNECEDRWLRFYQKGGDGEVDNNPLAMLSKGEVYQLCWHMATRFPSAFDAIMATIEATPSPDLWGTGDSHSDEAEFLSWTGAPFTYSRIDPGTGEYSYIGTIERVSRFLDLDYPDTDLVVADILFASTEPGVAPPDPTGFIVAMTTLAKRSGYFDYFSRSEVETFLMAARKAEAVTRHKMNPNCPTYGSRADLVERDILTNDFLVVA